MNNNIIIINNNILINNNNNKRGVNVYDIMCEGFKCSLSEKCIAYEEKHGINKCRKKKRFQIRSCQNDKRNTCLICDNFENCIIPLQYNEKLNQIQYRIAEIMNLLKKDKGDDYLKEELKTLRLKEKEKIKYLQRKYGDNMEIIIDSREIGKRDLTTTRKERAKDYYKEYSTNIENLEYGDYVFKENDINVVFEYKTIDDFMQSIFNSSVFEEVANQSNQYEYSYLIVVGYISKYQEASYRAFARKNYTRKNWNIKCDKAYKGAMRRIRTYSNVITVRDEPQAFEEMLQQSKKCFDNKAYAGCKRRVLSQNSVEYYLSGCSGVSTKSIHDIIETLKIESLEDLLFISMEDLQTVHRIGKKKAERIYNWIQGGEKA